MTNYVQHVVNTPQTEPADPAQQPNNAGGYSFTLDCWKRLDRWLILGSDGGTYYVSERKLTRANAAVVEECLRQDGPRTVARIAEISNAGRAPKNDPAIFALALAASHADPKTRAAALAALPVVCRIGTHLFHFAEAVNALRGWGRGLRKAVGNWYLNRTAKDAAFQLVKYQQRDGWSHRDLLKLCHVSGGSAAHQAAFRWAVNERSLAQREVKRRKSDGSVSVELQGAFDPAVVPELLTGYEELLKTEKPADVVKLIERYRFTHEMIPSQHKNSPDVWKALLLHMPLGALVRNLGKLTAVGVIAPLSIGGAWVSMRVGNREEIHKARLHPIALLSALRVYSQGHGDKGSLTWKPDQRVVDALDEAFYMAFDAITPTNKALLLALDVSGSMGCSVAGVAGLTARDICAAMAMATARTEPNHHFVAFSSTLVDFNVSPKQRLDDVIKKMDAMPFGGTDCSAPMVAAAKQKWGVDAFVTLTDSETWAGNVHPHTALKKYRQESGRHAKMVVIGTTATDFSIADKSDPGSLDVVGFSTDTPQVISDFVRED